jgi:NAD(P)-dependent dehydrogenase (short-subunit alcohol dehydrogenase family)
MKIVVITGSTRGIGYGLADAFLSLGCAVVISGRNSNTLQQAYTNLSAKYGMERLLAHPCDVIDYAQVEALWGAAVARFGRVDVWINNAGIANRLADLWELPTEDIRAVIETNMLGAIYGARVALIGMRAQGSGSIYNMEGLGSGGGRKVKGLALYGTTKAGLFYFNQSLAIETQGSPIIVGAIRPGMVMTDMLTKQYEGQPEAWEKVKPLFNILSDRVETIAPWIAPRVLANQKNGAIISWSNGFKIGLRFLTAPFVKRKVIE